MLFRMYQDRLIPQNNREQLTLKSPTGIVFLHSHFMAIGNKHKNIFHVLSPLNLTQRFISKENDDLQFFPGD